jgi:hypothetical protein
MEVAEGIALLVSYKWTQADIAKKMGKTPAWINQVLSRLEASDKVKTALEQGQIPVTVLQSIVATGKKYGKENNVTDQHAKQDDALSVHLTGKLEKKEQGTIRTGKRGRPSGSASTANTGNNAKPSNASAQKPSNNPAPSTNNAPSNASNKKNASNAPSNGKKPSNNGTVKSAFENEKDPAFKHELIKTEQEIIRHRKNVGLANILLMLLNFENSTDADACHDYNAALRTCLGHINGIDKGKK